MRSSIASAASSSIGGAQARTDHRMLHWSPTEATLPRQDQVREQPAIAACCAPVAGALLACDTQVDGGYRGEPIATIHGTVAASAALESVPEVNAAIAPRSRPSRCNRRGRCDRDGGRKKASREGLSRVLTAGAIVSKQRSRVSTRLMLLSVERARHEDADLACAAGGAQGQATSAAWTSRPTLDVVVCTCRAIGGRADSGGVDREARTATSATATRAVSARATISTMSSATGAKHA